MNGLTFWLQLFNLQAIDIDFSLKLLHGILAHEEPHRVNQGSLSITLNLLLRPRYIAFLLNSKILEVYLTQDSR